MHQVLISIGSNHLQSVYTQWASERLTQLLHNCHLSRRLWTADVKGSGCWYMNRLATGYTELTAEEIIQQLKQTEATARRSKEKVRVDLDLLQYDDMRYHLKDWSRPYVTQLIEKWE